MIWPIAPASAAGSGLVTGSRALARRGSLSGMSGTPVEGFDGAALPVEEGEAGQRDDERDEKERGPVEAEVARIRSVARRGPDVHAAERRERRKQRVLGRGEAMIAEGHEERHECG